MNERCECDQRASACTVCMRFSDGAARESESVLHMERYVTDFGYLARVSVWLEVVVSFARRDELHTHSYMKQSKPAYIIHVE